MNLRYEYAPEVLRVAYSQYLRIKYPESSKKSISTRVDDAYCLFRWMSEDEAWMWFLKDEGDLKTLRKILANEFLVQRKNPMKDAGGYIRAIKEFQEFLKLVSVIEDARIIRPRTIHRSGE